MFYRYISKLFYHLYVVDFVANDLFDLDLAVTNVKPMVVQPTQAPVAPAVSTMVSKCPATIQCMSTCEHGYTLGPEGRDGCPSCACINPKTSK